jgi:transmembrane sensor
MNEEKYWNLMSRYLANDLSLAETDELLKWVDDDPPRAILLRELRETWDQTQDYPGHLEVDPTAAWHKVKQSVSVQSDPKIRPLYSFRIFRVAASLLILLAAGLTGYRYYVNTSLVHVNTLAGEHREVVLPDGSKIWLNEASSLVYHTNFNDRSLREVELNGEAFFEVTKNPNKRFVISTGKTLTQVLGTSFNVEENENGTISVAVVTGRVSFGPAEEKEKYILLSGDNAQCDKQGVLSRGKYDNTNFLFWKNHHLAFENTSFGEVLKTIEQAYAVSFSVADPDLLNQKITTSFNQASLNQVVDVLEILLDLKITRSGSVYVVKQN